MTKNLYIVTCDCARTDFKIKVQNQLKSYQLQVSREKEKKLKSEVKSEKKYISSSEDDDFIAQVHTSWTRDQ